MPPVLNLFAGIDRGASDEVAESLLARPGAPIERIVSTGQHSPDGLWYDQAWDEWVILLAGADGLEVEGSAERILSPGDYVLLPARCRHRVTWTDRAAPTVWLAVHLGEPGD